MHSWFKAKLGVFKKIRKTYEYFTNTDQQWIVFFAAPFIQKITVLVVVVVLNNTGIYRLTEDADFGKNIIFSDEKLILILAGKITVLVVVVVFTTIGKRHTSKKVPVMKYFTVVP